MRKNTNKYLIWTRIFSSAKKPAPVAPDFDFDCGQFQTRQSGASPPPPASETPRLLTTARPPFSWPSVSTPFNIPSVPGTLRPNSVSPKKRRILSHCLQKQILNKIREKLILKKSRERSFSKTTFPDILLRSGINNFKLRSNTSTPEVNGGKLSNIESFKTHIAETSGFNNALIQTLSLRSFPSDDLWESETLGLKPRYRQRRSTFNNIDIIIFDVCLRPRFFITYATISKNKLFRKSSSPLSRTTFSSGAHGGWLEMAVSVPAVTTTDSLSIWDELIASNRITLFSEFPKNNKSWLSCGGFIYFIH